MQGKLAGPAWPPLSKINIYEHAKMTNNVNLEVYTIFLITLNIHFMI